ncbi:MAG: hypothetical protein H7281_06075 [Bacteriovorax sp.]|nr:hypothetical protein [Bacteriovorax sp.]
MSAPLKVLGIYREEKFSNRAIEADKEIMDEVLKSLSFTLGDSVVFTKIRPEDIAYKVLDFNYDLVFSMAQEEHILSYLELLESRGTVVVNSSKSVRNCYRGKLSELLSDDAFSYPRFISLKVEQVLFKAFDSKHGYWVKRGDFHALSDDDVVHIETIDQLGAVLENFKNRGVDEVILQESLEGELFKFYGVRDSFFNLRYMGKTSNDRYSNIPGNSDIIFDRGHLERLVHMAARILELDYFGGDCIISDKGKMHFIDFNDWPSFRSCRNSVAPNMASYALNKLKSGVSNACSFVQ